jgi:hypothetical protein
MRFDNPLAVSASPLTDDQFQYCPATVSYYRPYADIRRSADTNFYSVWFSSPKFKRNLASKRKFGEYFCVGDNRQFLRVSD